MDQNPSMAGMNASPSQPKSGGLMKMIVTAKGGQFAKWAPMPLRLTLAIIFIFHGLTKVFGPQPGLEGFTGFLTSLNVPIPGFFGIFIAWLELVGGFAFLLGFLTPLFAKLIALELIVAWFLTKLGGGLMVNGIVAGELDIAIVGLAIALAMLGAGPLSIDAKLARKYQR
ncbi:MAG TPA: DoxX family protein [Candidatus Saccharimonadales bacterium]